MKKSTLQALAKKLWAERMPLPEATVGEYKITHTPHKAGDKLMITGMREAFLTGLPASDLITWDANSRCI